MNKKLIIVIVVIIIAGIGIWFWYSRNAQVLSVEQTKVQLNRVEKTISASGKIVSENQADLSFAASGRITNLTKKEGDMVKKGELLASLNTESTRQSTQAYKDARDAVIKDRDLFIRQFQNDQSAAGGSTEYQLKLKKLDEQVSQAEATYQASLANIRNYYVYAPFDGTVFNQPKEIGEIASMGETIVQIANLTDLYFEGQIDQEDFGVLQDGQPARITLDAYPNQTINGVVQSLPEYVSSSSTSTFFKIKVVPTDTDKNLLLGMEGDVEIVVAQTKSEVNTLIFDEVFKNTDGSSYVWVIDSRNKLQKLPVELGLEGDLYTEVKTDISNQTIIIPSNTKQILEEQRPAKVINKK